MPASPAIKSAGICTDNLRSTQFCQQRGYGQMATAPDSLSSTTIPSWQRETMGTPATTGTALKGRHLQGMRAELAASKTGATLHPSQHSTTVSC